MKLLKKLWKKVSDMYFRFTDYSNLSEDYQELGDNYEEVKEQNDVMFEEIKDLDKAIIGLNKSLAKYKHDDVHSSLGRFKSFLQTLTPTEIQYRFKNKLQPVHEVFEESLLDEKVIRDFTTKTMKFNTNIKSITDAESLVMTFCRRFRLKYSNFIYYTSDMSLYGKSEYWANAKETIYNIAHSKKYGDCDDKMVLVYSCLYYLLKDNYPNDMWRLRGMIADLWSGGGHALLTWVSNEHNDWIALETTFKDVWQDKISSYRVRNQMFYQIRYTFDNKHEYVKQ